MTGLTTQRLLQDPRIHEAKQLLLAALKDHQSEMTGIKDPIPESVKDYQSLINHCSQLRGGKLFFPYLSSGIGKGALVELADGSIKYDFITGIGVYYYGHSHPKILEAAIDAALESTLMQGNLQQSAATVPVLEKFLKLANAGGTPLPYCFLSSSGAMANENALKIIFQKRSPAHRFLAFRHCFAGRSLVMSQITDKPANREGLPKVLEVDYIPFFDPENPQDSRQKAVRCLQDCLQKHPQEYAGMCFELIQGEGGYYSGETIFFQTLMDILKKNQIAIFIDEIQTFGRTTKPFAYQYYQLDQYPDVVTLGKLTQVCATLFSEEYKPKPGLLSQTFTASSSAIHAANFILQDLLDSDYFGEKGRIARFHQRFLKHLEDIHHRHREKIHGPFGLGAMIGFSVFNGSAELTKLYLDQLFEAGVLAFTAGQDPQRIRFLMPIPVVQEKDIDRVCQIIEETLIKVAQLKPDQ